MSKYVSRKFYESGYDRTSISTQVTEWLNELKPESFTVVKMQGNETELVALVENTGGNNE